MNQTTWVNIHKEPCGVYVGRPRAGERWGYGNPFRVGRDGQVGQCVQKFLRWLQTGDSQGCPDATPERRQWIWEHLAELRGQVLGCFCAPKDCHARILAELADALPVAPPQVTEQRGAFIGTKKLDQIDPHRRNLLFRAVGKFVSRNQAKGQRAILHTGAAPGVDQVCAELCLQLGGEVELFRPWATHEQDWVHRMLDRYPGRVRYVIYHPVQHAEWTTSVTRFHPYFREHPEQISRGVQALHARNYGIIEAVDFVVALPKSGPEGGGTGQGVRIANGLGKYLWNLYLPTGRPYHPGEHGWQDLQKSLGDYQLPQRPAAPTPPPPAQTTLDDLLHQ